MGPALARRGRAHLRNRLELTKMCHSYNRSLSWYDGPDTTRVGKRFMSLRLILALATTEPAIVPVRAVLWLDDESTA
jgi:hypothetical protein